MTLNRRQDDDVFANWCKRNLPPFIFESFVSDEDRLNEMFDAWDSVFQTLYGSLSGIIEELDVDTATAEHLYYLGRELGVEELVNLTMYLNADGTVNTSVISQPDFDILLAKQRVTIKFCLFRYLMKGTNESISRYLYEKDFPATVIEKWFTAALGPTSGSIPWPLTEADMPQDVLDYGSTIWDAPSGSMFYQDILTTDIAQEIKTDIPSLSADTEIGVNVLNQNYPGEIKSWMNQLVANNYGYTYLISWNYRFFYKTPSDMLSSTTPAQPTTWYESLGKTGVTGIIVKVDTFTDKIVYLTDAGNLSIISCQQDMNDVTPEPFFTSDNTDITNFILFDLKTKILIDRGSTFEVRDLNAYQIVWSSVTKPVGFTGVINSFEYVGQNNLGVFYLATDNLNKAMLILIGTDGTISIVNSYSHLPIRSNNDNWNAYSTTPWTITICECYWDELLSLYMQSFHYLNIDESTYTMNFVSDNRGSTPRHTKRLRLSTSILTSTYSPTFVIFDLITRRIYTDTSDPTNGDLYIFDMFMLDKLCLLGAYTNPGVWLYWTDNSPNEDGFIVYRSPDGLTNWTEVQRPSAGSTFTLLTSADGVDPSVTNWFRVTAYQGGGESDPTNTTMTNCGVI